MAPTRMLATFASTLAYDQLPAALVSTTRQYLLDTIGCGIYGGETPWAKAVNTYILEQGGRPDATLWLQGFRGPAASVALGLGVMMHSFELDDYHSGAKLHPGAVVIPAAFTVAERQGASGQALLSAIVAGYELMIRTSLAAGTLSMRRRGWHITGMCGTFGAAAAAGQLLGLDSDGMANALAWPARNLPALWRLPAMARIVNVCIQDAPPEWHPGSRTGRTRLYWSYGRVGVC